jgi:uncharacterized RDD family membrane protein YckC
VTVAEGAARPATPGLARRLACFLYEGVLLFGIVMVTGLIYGVLMQQRHALSGADGLKAVLFVVLGGYFVFFWCRSGQTLALLTWHIRLVTLSGAPVTPLRALARYLLSWLWFLPALALVHFWGLHGASAIGGAVLTGVLGYASLTRLHPDRQYWHDAVCRTRLISWYPPHRQPKASA